MRGFCYLVVTLAAHMAVIPDSAPSVMVMDQSASSSLVQAPMYVSRSLAAARASLLSSMAMSRETPFWYCGYGPRLKGNVTVGFNLKFERTT
jgi:hypothetical protein